MFVLLTLLPLPTGAADAMVDLDVHGTKLPSGRQGAAAVWTGSEVLIFGGVQHEDRELLEIVRYDPVSGGVRQGAPLPHGTGWGWAHWDGNQAHVGGGGGVASKVIRYHPATDTTSTSTNYEPFPRDHAAPVSVDGALYLFGGRDTDAIMKYDPALDLWVELQTALPTPRFGMAAARVGTHIYLFGGHTNAFNGSESRTFDEILRFDLSTGELSSMAARLPAATKMLRAHWDGSRVHLLGGETAEGLTDQVLLYDPASDVVEVAPQRLPQPRKSMAVAETPHGIFLIGGFSDAPYAWDTPSADIVRYDPAAGVFDEQRVLLPTALRAMAGAWNSQQLDLFGGYDGELHDRIHRYDPAIRDLVQAPGLLPTPMAALAAAHHSGITYLFGGAHAADGSTTGAFTHTDGILTYHPSTGEVSPHPTSLPAPRAALIAVTHGHHIYLLGGLHLDEEGTVRHSSEIFRFTPATGELVTMPTALNTTYRYVAAASSGEHIYLLASWADQPIHRYDPASGELTPLPLTLPKWRDRHGIFWTGEALHVLGAHLETCEGDMESGCSKVQYLESIVLVPRTGEVFPGATAEYVCCGFATWAGDRAYIHGTRDPCADRYDCVLDQPRRNLYEYQVGPGAPQNLTASVGQDGLLRVEWSLPHTSGTMPLTGYRVYSVNGATRTSVAQLPADTRHYETALPAAGSSATFEVKAVSSVGEGRAGRLTYAVPPGPPTAPRSLAGTLGDTADSIRLTWLPPSHDGGVPVEGYRLYRTSDDTPSELVAELGIVSSYQDAPLPLAGTYRYALAAWNAVGEGAAAEVHASTAMPPSPPRAVSAKGGPAAGEITITWQTPSRTDKLPLDAYTIYVRNGSSWEPLARVTGSVTSHVHGDLAEGTSYAYRVTATTAAGEGEASAGVTASTFSRPFAPRDLKASQTVWPGEVRLTWLPPLRDGGAPITSWQVYRANDQGDMEQVATVQGQTSFTDRGRALGTWYRYEVTATNIVGEGEPSLPAHAAGTGVFFPTALVMAAVMAPRFLRKP